MTLLEEEHAVTLPAGDWLIIAGWIMGRSADTQLGRTPAPVARLLGATAALRGTGQ